LDYLGVVQSLLFHAASQLDDRSLPIIDFLLSQGAGFSLCVKLPGHYGRHDEFLECSALDYTIAFSGDQEVNANATVSRLRKAAQAS
jgi:hypothetical protein